MISKINHLLKTSLALLAINLSGSHLGLDAAVTQLTTSNRSNQIAVAADNANNANAVFPDNGIIEARSITGTDDWASAVTLSNTNDFSFYPAVAMDATGTGLAAWVGFSSDTGAAYIQSATYSDGIWTTLPDLLDSAGNAQSPSVAMDGFGNGLAVWSTGDIHASFYSAGVWSPFATLGTAVPSAGIKASYSPSGNASAVWSNFDIGINNIWASTYDGTSWQTLINLDSAASSFPAAGIDDFGNTIAIWSTGSGDIVVRSFDGTSWSDAQTLSTATGNQTNPAIAVAFDGTAVAVWADGANNIQMNLFDGAIWSAPILVATGSGTPQIAMDSNGNAVIGWVTTAGEIFYANLPKDSAAVENVTALASSGGTQVIAFNLALSDASSVSATGFATWIQGVEVSNAFGASFELPLPAPPPATPTGLNVQVCNNRFASQSDCTNTITWDASDDSAVVSYNLFKNGDFLANILATDPLVFQDDVLSQETTDYSLTAVDGNDQSSDPADFVVTCTCPSCG